MINILYSLALIAGIVTLIFGANWFVSGASSIAKKLKVPALIIGLTIVAIGTSLPELAVSLSSAVSASINHTTADISLGNVIGSNIANISLIMGVCLLFGTVQAKGTMKKLDIFFFLFSITATVVFLFLFPVDGSYGINRYESIFLFICFIIFMTLLIYINKRDMKKNAETIVDETDSEESKIVLLSTKKSIIFFILGLVGVVGGGVLTTFGAENLSVNLLSGLFGMEISKAKTLIGLSVVAIGTSLPELVTSVVALRKKETELSIGNVVGSNIFNILMIVGLAGTVFPLSANKDVLLDALICLGISVVFSILIMFVNKIGKKTGIFFLCFFIAYITFIILRALEVFVIW